MFLAPGHAASARAIPAKPSASARPATAGQFERGALPAVAWAKALACQCIIWHHLLRYGALSQGFDTLWPGFVRWASHQAVMAVQVFLVVGGFLAARALWPQADQPRARLAHWPMLLWRRLRRLAPPYWAALLAAITAASLARLWLNDVDTPAAPEWSQLLAHLGFVQGLTEHPSLSTGLWYVAIDLQLYLMLAALAGLVHRGRLGSRLGTGALLACAAASLWVFNLDSSFDNWGLYFFGAYALGVLAHWGRHGGARLTSAVWLILLTAIALWLGWRDRIAVAGACALLLLWLPGALPLPRLVAWLARHSYGMFLMHYPVSLAVASALAAWSTDDTLPAASGLVLTWLLSLLAGWALTSCFDTQVPAGRSRPDLGKANPAPGGAAY